MVKQLSMKMLLFLLICGEILTISAGILSHVSTEKVALMIAVFSGMWIIFILANVWVDRMTTG